MSAPIARFTPMGDVVIYDDGMQAHVPAEMIPALRALLAGDQPDAEDSGLPNGHAPVEELSPFLHRRIQPEAAPLNSCGRGICALNDGHSGRCTT